jgi:metal-dependent amidase/aminoacylase/carboxypeptidase family protein
VHSIIKRLNNAGKRSKSNSGYYSVHVANVSHDPNQNQWDLECALFETDEKMFAAAKAEIDRLLAESAGNAVKVENFEIIRGVPPLVNDVNLMRNAYEISKPMLGEENVIIRKERLKTQSGEDFGRYQKHIPGAYIFLGVSNKAKGINGSVHTPQFAVDEEAICIGIDLMKGILLGYLHEKK